MHEKDDDYFGKTLNTIQETSFTGGKKKEQDGSDSDSLKRYTRKKTVKFIEREEGESNFFEFNT